MIQHIWRVRGEAEQLLGIAQQAHLLPRFVRVVDFGFGVYFKFRFRARGIFRVLTSVSGYISGSDFEFGVHSGCVSGWSFARKQSSFSASRSRPT